MVDVWVAFSSSDGTHIDSKSKMARLLKSVLSFETRILKPSNFSNAFLEVYIHSLDKCVALYLYKS